MFAFAVLRVIVLDATAIVRAAARAGLCAAATTGQREARAAADAEGEEDDGDEERGVGAPEEAECVGADLGGAAGVVEAVAGLDKGGAAGCGLLATCLWVDRFEAKWDG